MQKLLPALRILLVVFFSLVLWLCFFQLPAVEDLIGVYFKEKLGVAGGWHWYLGNENGRFTSIPIFLTISSIRPLIEDYYGLTLILLLLITFAITFYFVKSINRILFDWGSSRSSGTLVAALLLTFFIAIVPEPSTFLYWMATVVTFTIPLVLFLWLFCAYALLLKDDQQHRWTWAFMTGMLTIFLAGCNEITLFYGCALPFLLGGVLLLSRQRIPVQLYFVMVIAVMGGLLSFWLPGEQIRINTGDAPQSLIASGIGAAFRTWKSIQLIFSEPLFYVSCFGVLIAAAYLKQPIAERFASKKSSWWFELAVVVAMLFGFHLILRYVAQIVTPPRADNALICLTVIGIWWILLMNAGRMKTVMRLIREHQTVAIRSFAGLIVVTLLTAGFSWELMKNLVSAPIHHAVLQERVNLINTAKEQGKKTAFIPPYQETADVIIRKKYGKKAQFVQDEFALPASLSFFQDEPYHPNHVSIYAEFYGIDSISTTHGTYPRWDLSRFRYHHHDLLVPGKK